MSTQNNSFNQNNQKPKILHSNQKSVFDCEDYTQLNPMQRKLYAAMYKKSFYQFCKDFWSEADPSRLVDGVLVQFLCEVFQYLCRWWIGYEPPEEDPYDLLPPQLVGERNPTQEEIQSASQLNKPKLISSSQSDTRLSSPLEAYRTYRETLLTHSTSSPSDESHPYDPTPPKIKPIKYLIHNDEINVIDVRNNLKNININISPRHSKSMILNVLSGPWVWTNAPIKLASVSHTRDLAGVMNEKRQKILNSEKFKFFFPEIQLVKNTAYSLIDSRGGELYSINRDALTGYGFDIGVCDDLTNAEQARKDQTEMQNAQEFFRNTLPTRVNDVSKYAILNIQQRLAPNDITGFIASDPVLASIYTNICLPAQFKKETYLICPISGDVIHFAKGDFLWAERFGDYQGLRAQVGETVWQCQYMQEPSQSDKTIIKEHMLREEDATAVPGWDISSHSIILPQVDMVYATHDFPVKDKATSDFLGSLLAYRIKKTLYVIDCQELKQDFTKSIMFVKTYDQMYPGIIQVIEDKANGSPLMTLIQDEVPGMRAYNPGQMSKEDRLIFSSPFVEAGNVVLVRTEFNQSTNKYQLSKNLQNLKERIINFPFVEHDDIVDAFTMCVLYVFMDAKYSVYYKSFNELNQIDTTDFVSDIMVKQAARNTSSSIASIINTDGSYLTEVQIEKLLTITQTNSSKISSDYDYSTIFFTKLEDEWKVCEIGIKYGSPSKMILLRETTFKASVQEGLIKIKEFAPEMNVFIDCSAVESLTGYFQDGMVVERYAIDDFDKSVTDLSYAMAQNKVIINTHCKLTTADIESFKFSKSAEKGRYVTQKDGFVGCLRVAQKYFGGLS